MNDLLCLQSITKSYNVGKENELEILHGIDLSVQEGEFAAIVGESGSGKSTLMNILGILDTPTSGSYLLDGIDMSKMNPDQMSEYRNTKIGFVFQNFNLVARSSALHNVELPALYAGDSPLVRREKAEKLLELVGMKDRMNHNPNELSGGQKQRVAIARSLINNPKIILADEPTGALDSETSENVISIFERLHREEQKTIILITHSKELAQRCPRVITLVDGRITSDSGRGVYAD
ncbi:MAG: ABC transporter ATP-binding protein [Erysipelotrichia bacterium]|nr:ABC transporter ATP-binding protein [Erysipelotrichia bacterium]